MEKPSHDPSIEHEPHLRPYAPIVDASEQAAEQTLAAESRRATIDDDVEHTIWDEPALASELLPPGGGGRLTYASWLDARIDATPSGRTWQVTLLVVLAAGPWGIIGAFANGASGLWGILAVTVAAPVTEEMMKIAAALWVVEKRPYLFRMPFQILVCAVAGGLAFAFVENLIYLNIYIPEMMKRDPGFSTGPNYPVWRWTVCTGLHATCSFFAGLGLVSMWSHAVANRVRPQIAHAAPMIIAAMIGHGLYNGLVTIAELGGWLKF